MKTADPASEVAVVEAGLIAGEAEGAASAGVTEEILEVVVATVVDMEAEEA